MIKHNIYAPGSLNESIATNLTAISVISRWASVRRGGTIISNFPIKRVINTIYTLRPLAEIRLKIAFTLEKCSIIVVMFSVKGMVWICLIFLDGSTSI